MTDSPKWKTLFHHELTKKLIIWRIYTDTSLYCNLHINGVHIGYLH